MRECPKCSLQYDENHKICRACGAALQDVEPSSSAEEPPGGTDEEQAPLLNENARAEVSANRASWKCPQCGQAVPGDFEVCWNCGTSEDGEPDPGFSKAPADDDWPELQQSLEPASTAEERVHRCPKCGSSKVISDTRILDRAFEGKLQVLVFGDPDALIFKDRLFGTLTADVCGDCGHVELKVENPGELYEHYLWSKVR